MTAPSLAEDDLAASHPARDFVFLWHAAWAGALLVGGLALAAGGQITSSRIAAALAAGAAPAVVGMMLAPARDAGRARATIAGWALGATAAGFLTGGAGGPLAAWCLTPFAAAFALRQSSLAPFAAASAVAAAAVAAAAAVLADVAPPPAETARWLGLLALVTLGGALGSAIAAGGLGASREALKSHPALLVGLDAQGRITGLFGRAPHGLKAAELMGRGVAAAAAGPHRALLHEALRRAGEEGWAEAGFPPAHDPRGWVVAALRRRPDGGFSGILRDARAERARELALIEERDAADSRNAGKSRFLANMSHELRTPLNAIMGFSDIMRQRLFGALPDRYGEYADLIHESGSHLLELINDVLDMSKIEAERFELAREGFDAREAVSAVLRLMRGQADRAGVQLRGILPKDALEVDADRRAVKQIVLNLISNALKFTPRDGSVTVTAQAAGGALEIVVTDTGVGISAEDLARLGRPYEQAGGAEQRSAGTGLGLSLVRAFAKLHGGDMTIESVLGEGTSVTVRLPVLAPEPEAMMAQV